MSGKERKENFGECEFFVVRKVRETLKWRGNWGENFVVGPQHPLQSGHK
jgi:hypothetical protein